MTELATPIACADQSRHTGESCGGSASRARRWVLLEQPGPWGSEALEESRLPPTVAAQLRTWSRELPARVLLLRRPPPAPVRSTSESRTLLVASTQPGGEGFVERFTLDDPADALDLDLTALSAGRSVGGEPLTDGVYLVCTNGRHDPCCARYGRPVVNALGAQPDLDVWECSHVGGDRFAGNLVCLPSGMLYGHLDPTTALEAVTADRSGRVALASCRGRSALSFPQQAAELAVRSRLGIEKTAAVRFLGASRDGNRHHVRFATADGFDVAVVIDVGRAKAPRPLTCGGDAGRPPTYEVASFEATRT